MQPYKPGNIHTIGLIINKHYYCELPNFEIGDGFVRMNRYYQRAMERHCNGYDMMWDDWADYYEFVATQPLLIPVDKCDIKECLIAPSWTLKSKEELQLEAQQEGERQKQERENKRQEILKGKNPVVRWWKLLWF